MTTEPLKTTPEALNEYAKICLDACDKAEHILREQQDTSPIANMAREVLFYAGHLRQFGDMLGEAYTACDRIADCLFEHPRLLLQLKQLTLDIVLYGEQVDGKQYSVKDLLREQIDRLQANIQAADEGRWNDIHDDRMLKSDPVEWTKEYEDVIDEADHEAFSHLTDCPRGMGFCFAYWMEKSNALAKRGIEWRTPSSMNPGVMFD